MKRKLVCALVVGALALSGCAADTSETESSAFRVAYMVPGSLGDLGYLDSANTGIKKVESEMDADTRVIEAGADASAWKQSLQTLSGQGYDVIVTADSGNNPDNVKTIAAQNPD